MKKLENLLQIKDEEIKDLESKIRQLERERIFNHRDSDLDTESDSSIAEGDDSSENSSFPESSDIYECDKYDFKTMHDKGLKVHA